MGIMNANAALYEQTLTYKKSEAPRQCLSYPWWVRTTHKTYYPRHGCTIKPLNCGEAVFAHIAEDLGRAESSVDIISWGFDPGMVFVRGSHAEAGTRFGDLLIELATREKPVIVRILIWYGGQITQRVMRNIPGYYGGRFSSVGSDEQRGFLSDSHNKYNAKWFKDIHSGKYPNIRFRVRAVATKYLDACLANETMPESLKAWGAALFATHHQKMMLIDYERPQSAVGYVMGHNSMTDFWDTTEHKYRDSRRERFYRDDHAELQKKAWKQGSHTNYTHGYQPSDYQIKQKESAVQTYLDNNSFIAKPYQDVSCRLEGPVLYDLNHNFVQAWQESTVPSSFFEDLTLAPAKTILDMHVNALNSMMKFVFDTSIETDDKYHDEGLARRNAIRLKEFTRSTGAHSVQLMRTQPMHGEKAIKECYANLSRLMQHYIFIQNQYVQYEEWAEYLVECASKLRAAGFEKPIFAFILTSTPELDGMDLPTYDVARELGQSQSMKVVHEEAVEEAKAGKRTMPITEAKLAKQGIRAVMGSLWTFAKTPEDRKLRPEFYEEIYIHSKVAIVDDAAFTLGSANLNLRSMAIDSELNILSQSQDVAYQLRADLFRQCTNNPGPGLFGDMESTFDDWKDDAQYNAAQKSAGLPLKNQLVAFYVDRKPGTPIV